MTGRGRPRLLLVIVTVALAAAAAGCDRGGSDAGVVLDGRPRLPDAEGIVEEVSFERLTLDGGRTYRVTRDLQSFASQTMQAVPLLQRKGQYVHVGLDGDRVAWVAAIGSVLPGDPPTVYYTGRVKAVAAGRLTFADGTVLRLADGVEVPDRAVGVEVVAELDPASHRVRAVTPP